MQSVYHRLFHELEGTTATKGRTPPESWSDRRDVAETDVAKAGTPSNLIALIDDLAATEHKH